MSHYRLIAQEGYKLLEPTLTPGIEQVGSGNFTAYIHGLYIAILTITVVLSLVVFTYGAFQYTLSIVPGIKQDGKDNMTNALFGLGIALASYLILQTINPDLVSLKALTDIISGLGS